MNTGDISVFNKYRLIYYGDTLAVKGKYDITSYDDKNVMLKCDGDYVYISGENFEIQSLNSDEIYIKGNIFNISIS